MCKRLLCAGANIRATDANGQNCIHLALWHSKMDILQLFERVLSAHSHDAFEQTLLDRDCRGWSSLHTCILKSGMNSVFVRWFEKWVVSVRGLELNTQDGLGCTLLHMACSYSYDCARFLLEQGALVDVKDSILGWTPLHHACNEGNSEIWNLLLAYETDIFLRNDLMGWTPVHIMEQAMDCLRLESGETWTDGEEAGPWTDDEGNAVEEDDGEWQDEDSENEKGKVKASNLDSATREALARRRARLRSRVTRFVTEESMRRITRPVRQADVDREIDLARTYAFPQHRYLEEASSEVDGPLRMWNSRNMQRICLVDRQAKVRRRVPTIPMISTAKQHYRVWSIDPHVAIHGLRGLEHLAQ